MERLSIPPSMEPSRPPTGELVLSHDKHFALHGEIWLLVMVLGFALFLVFIIVFPRLRRRSRRRSSESDVSDSNINSPPRRRNCLFLCSRKRNRVDEVEAEEEQRYSNRINDIFPL
ncbi:hypothetical protein CCACVL1_11743 [Corchorus capsularis]|uniref:Uncharacterized protein n=1 Tax=Corchorus capsularis TaxID=210143 RepID=A0A1R3IJQ3_COCAP|nr:hypothetical protein CCACVL1_11743 [Corchorus capsularis]